MELSSKTSDIKRDGYILLPNALTNEELEGGLACMKHDNKVDYSIMKRFIDTIFFPSIQRNIGDVITQPKYVKFRFSNNNNSTDASTFHGDIYNHTKTQILPIYTCLCYFDDAQLEVIPGSHNYNNNGISLQSFNNRKALDVKRGDILVFHSNMHHRGINYNKKGLERLIKLICLGEIERLVVSHKDRLLRFGSEIIFSICEQHNVEIVIINKSINSTFEEELTNDVLEIITVFSAKLYGSRSHKNKKIIDKINEVKEKVENEILQN